MGSLSSQILIGSRRHIMCGLSGERVTRRLSPAALDADAQLQDLSPSQLLRFILTSSNHLGNESGSNSTLRKHALFLIDTEWVSGNPPPALWCALKGIHPTNRKEEAERLSSVNNLSSLKTVIERLAVDRQGAKLFNYQIRATEVMHRCEEYNTYTEIVSALSDINTRLKRLDLPKLTTNDGLYYAALDLAMPAFQQFLYTRQEARYYRLSFANGGSVINALSESIDSVLFERPDYDTKFLLAGLTGEGDESRRTRPTLHDVLHEAREQDRRNWSTYLCVLARIHSRHALIKSWKLYMAEFDSSRRDACHLAYNVVLALVRSGRSEEAAILLEDISQRSRDNLPHIATLHNLQVLLDDPAVSEALPDLIQGHQYEELLETRLQNMEARLGIRWEGVNGQGKNKAHVGVMPGSPWAVFKDQPLLTIDGDCAGYEDPVRLYSEIQAHGCSKSRSDLRQIVDLLNEHDGMAQRVEVWPLDPGMQEIFQTDFSSLEFQWCPEHSPLEFTDSPLPALSNWSENWTPAMLGLLRARGTVNGVPQDNNKCQHLIQLGTLDQRFGEGDSWLPSAYIVAWDRQFGEMIALYVGKGDGIRDRGPTPPDAPFGAGMLIRPTHMPGQEPWPCDRPRRIPARSYYLDIDPSPDLGFR
ncbi:uncharacterized protein N7482_004596 [Penicillium canariense]|uniref:Uncharacterized protein n=1 Tax=Penicillium canariense TaxID=189055 RepID=A0A9W9LPQ2_9EURO|nr:uncharacterized protein N7482_004596 [Penicillium canariense]KAJ5169002.1 hypothetical protein N7482_004596 [Penicillium canariense]